MTISMIKKDRCFFICFSFKVHYSQPVEKSGVVVDLCCIMNVTAGNSMANTAIKFRFCREKGLCVEGIPDEKGSLPNDSEEPLIA